MGTLKRTYHELMSGSFFAAGALPMPEIVADPPAPACYAPVPELGIEQ
jgi:hypothetical protein